jgi:hypothetical protein
LTPALQVAGLVLATPLVQLDSREAGSSADGTNPAGRPTRSGGVSPPKESTSPAGTAAGIKGVAAARLRVRHQGYPRAMTHIERIIPASPQDIFDVLADGWSYSGWVVGASHIRDVDPAWPAPGTRLHHSSGPWPITIDDVTVVLGMERDRRLELEARLWFFGKVTITLTLTAQHDGTTKVEMEETAVAGPVTVIPHAVQQALFAPRNAEALARLADMATGRGATLR